jgi:hypothetical protein
MTTVVVNNRVATLLVRVPGPPGPKGDPGGTPDEGSGGSAAVVISRLVDLDDVAAFGIADGEGLVWDDDTGRFIPGQSIGTPGDPGPAGVSVTNATVNGTGRLILTLSNGQQIDAGVVKGADGLPGVPGNPGPSGAPGASVTNAVVNAGGHLILTLSTGANIDAGVVKGDPGTPGTAGANGVSITNATIDATGHLILTLSDGTTIDAGVAKGADGTGTGGTGEGVPGPAGADGVSVTGAAIDTNGHLILTLSTGATIDAGVAVGPKGDTGAIGPSGTNGVSITGAAINGTGHLILTLSSGATVDAGTAIGPPGDAGPAGDTGANGVSVTGATINGTGHLVLSLSSGGTIDAGVAKGDKGDPGSQGIQGPPGPGVAAGGTTGQVLAKTSGADYATEWTTPATGGTGGGTPADLGYLFRPTGVIRETYERYLVAGSRALTSGALFLSGIPLAAGDQLTSVVCQFSTAPGTPTQLYAVLYNGSDQLVAVTTSDTTQGTPYLSQFNFAGPVTIGTTGIYYVGVVSVATTAGALRAFAGTSSPWDYSLAPALQVNDGSGYLLPRDRQQHGATLVRRTGNGGGMTSIWNANVTTGGDI